MLTFFRPEMVLDEHTHPGPVKARQLMLTDVGMGQPLFGGFEMAGLPQLSLVHSAHYVAGIFGGTLPNGFNTFSQDVAKQAAWCSGAMRAAAMWLAANQRGCAFVPASGFHHAGWNKAGGYCTFNGLALAVAAFARTANRRSRILIVDGDAHFGNGTDDILQRLASWAPSAKVTHVTNEYSSDRKVTADSLRTEVFSGEYPKWDLILYQAGADAWEGDPYGAGYASEQELADRDELVFTWARKRGIPVLWNLAGGYAGEDSLRLHTTTLQLATQVFGADVTPMPKL